MADIGDDLYSQAIGGSSKDGITVEAERGREVLGVRKADIVDPRLVHYDWRAARVKPPIRWEVTKDSQMSAVEAGNTLRNIYRLYGLHSATADVQEAALHAILFAHTLNGGSVLQPGRSQFSLGDGRHMLDYADLVQYLGPDLRRFFRAYANETQKVNKRVLQAASDPTDIVAQEKAAWLRAVAADRGLSRHPDLAHDTADAIWDLTDAERAAVTASKSTIFTTSPNMADRNRLRPGQSQEVVVGSMYSDPTARAHALAAGK